MKLKLKKEVKHVTGGQLGNVHFLFNTDAGSWTAMKEDVYKFLETAVHNGQDPVALGREMGFSDDELNQFVSHLSHLSILVDGDEEKSQSQPIELKKCYLHVVQACNLKCPTCYSWRPRRNARKQELSTETVSGALRQMKELGLTELVISGGEPLIRPDIVEILRMAKEEYRIETVVLLTNGTLVTEEIAQGIAKYADVVSVSVDGANEEENAKIRGAGSFDKAIKGIQIFKDAGVGIVNILPTITHKNVYRLHQFMEMAQRLNISISFSMFLGIGAGSQTGVLNELELTPSDMACLAKTIAADNPISQNMIAVEPCSVGLQATSGCGIGRDLISIDYDGTVYPCHMTMHPKLKMGKFPEQSIQEVLVGSPLAAHFRDFFVDRFDGCGECSIRYFCGGGCRANAYAVTANLLAHDPACSFYKPVLSSMLAPIVGAGNIAR